MFWTILYFTLTFFFGAYTVLKTRVSWYAPEDGLLHLVAAAISFGLALLCGIHGAATL